MNPRSDIEKVKDDLRKRIESRAITFKRSIVRELDRLYRETVRLHGTSNAKGVFSGLATKVLQQYHLNARDRQMFLGELREAQQQVAEVWQEYFGDLGLIQDLKPGEFERLTSLYQVDFPMIQREQRDMIVQELRRAARSEYSFETVKNRLLKRGLSAFHAGTLTNTALAQFDNASMHEYAAQAGIEKFLYDGVLHPSSRDFCKGHLGQEFTLDEIRAMDNGQGLPVLTSCGGYNCTHWWTPVMDKAKAIRPKAPSGTTRQSPVSDGIKISVRGDIAKVAKHVLKQIDKVHDDGVLTQIPLGKMSSFNTLGQFIAGRMSYNEPYRPLKIQVSTYSDHKHITAAHEIGHFIDFDGIGEKGSHSSVQGHQGMFDVIDTIRTTEAFHRIDNSPASARFKDYLRSKPELWARAYAQYITLRSNDPQMKEELDLLRRDMHHSQWSDEDFAPVAQSIDKLFADLEWR